MQLWRKRKAAKADRAFRDALARAVERSDFGAMPVVSQRYARLMLMAMNWWIEAGRAGDTPAPSDLLPAGAAPRNLILIEYIRHLHHPNENPLADAVGVINAQEQRLQGFNRGRSGC
jgi:alkylation response protein AidB-like acyl-CoA dehydrogenase